MPKNKIEDLRNILFETMERLMDPDDPMDVKTAAAVGDVAQVVVNSAKVEVYFIKQTGHGGSSFMQNAAQPKSIAHPIDIKQIESRPTPPSEELVPEEQLCTNCHLPTCIDTSSPLCPIRIQRDRLKAVTEQNSPDPANSVH